MNRVPKPTPKEVISTLISLSYTITEHGKDSMVFSNRIRSIPVNRELFYRSAEPILERWLKLVLAETDAEELNRMMLVNYAIVRVKNWLEAPPAART